MEAKSFKEIKVSDSVILLDSSPLPQQLSAQLDGTFVTPSGLGSELDRRMRTVTAQEFDPQTAQPGVYYFVMGEPA